MNATAIVEHETLAESEKAKTEPMAITPVGETAILGSQDASFASGATSQAEVISVAAMGEAIGATETAAASPQPEPQQSDVETPTLDIHDAASASEAPSQALVIAVEPFGEAVGIVEPTAVPPQPAPAPPQITPLIGSVDRMNFDQISGWAWDPSTPERSIDIEILDEDVVVLRVLADILRPDLLSAGIGNGRFGFNIRNLGGILPFSRHRVRVRRAFDGRDLPNSPQWITRPGLDTDTMTFMTAAVDSTLNVAATADDLIQPMTQMLQWLNDMINAHEFLLRKSKESTSISRDQTISSVHLTDRTRELVDNLLYSSPPLHFDEDGPPIVSVIIPVYNKFLYTYNCLKSIQAALPKRAFEIIIADDCSTDETLLCGLVFTGAVRIVRNRKNEGFVRTCNAGAAAAHGRYLLFLNNDTLVKPGWLDELVETFEQVPNIGIAGSKLLFEDGSLQEAGGIIWRLGDGWNWGRGRDPSEPGFMFLRDADWVSGAALMIERTMFEELKGFDELYVPAYYEDTDIAFRVRAMGKRVVVQPASEIVHLEGISAGTDTAGSGMKRFQVINHAKFYKRWKDTLLSHRFNGEHPELEAERFVRKRAYFIDETVPTPDQDAGSNAAVEHMRALMALGYKVTFLPADNMARIDPYTRQLQKLGVECLYHPFYWSVEEVFRKTQVKPDLIYLHRYTNAGKYATMVRRYFPNCRIVYSVADLHFLRMERQLAINPDLTSAYEVAMQRRAEMSAMENADCVIVHSPVEAEMLHGINSSLNVKVVPWTVLPRPSPLPFAKRSGAAFVGGFDHPPNADAVQFFVSSILPLLQKEAPDLNTFIIGSKMPDSISALRQAGLTPVGFVPILADVLHKLRATVVPLRYGAGIKGKVLESFAHGLPCVMSEVAAEGLELPEELAWLVARSPAEFAEKMVRLETDETFNTALATAGLAYIAAKHSTNVVRDALRAAVIE
jgi:GT2 family glycosyltransferase/glycosyltransferase involved in cell wall biosynthesis